MSKAGKVDLQVKLASATRENFANAIQQQPDLLYVLAHAAMTQNDEELLLFEDINGNYDRVKFDDHFKNMLKSQTRMPGSFHFDVCYHSSVNVNSSAVEGCRYELFADTHDSRACADLRDTSKAARERRNESIIYASDCEDHGREGKLSFFGSKNYIIQTGPDHASDLANETTDGCRMTELEQTVEREFKNALNQAAETDAKYKVMEEHKFKSNDILNLALQIKNQKMVQVICL